MIRRTLPLVALALALIVLPANAFGQQANGSHGGQRLKQAIAQLDLSAAQKQQIKQILEEAKKQRESSSTAAGAAGHSHAGRAVLEKIMNVLTPAQKAKLKQILQADRSQHTATA